MYERGSAASVDISDFDAALVGLTPTEAQAKVAASGWVIRVGEQDGVSLVVTADRQPSRINVAVIDGRIARVMSNA